MILTFPLYDDTNVALTGEAGNTILKIIRLSNNYSLDWNDSTFKASGWTTLGTALSELDSTNYAGIYYKSIDISAWVDGEYMAFVYYTGAIYKRVGRHSFFVFDGKVSDEESQDNLSGMVTILNRFNFDASDNVLSNPNLDSTDLTAISNAVHQGYGDSAITITILESDSSGTPLVSTNVIVRNSGDTLTLFTKITDTNGQASFTLPNGSYIIRLTKAGVNFSTTETLTVSGATTDTYYGTSISTSALNPNIQVLKGYVWDLGRTAVAGDIVSARIAEDNIAVSPGIFTDEILEATSDATGYFELQLVIGTKVVIKAEDYWSKEITVDSNATKWLADY